jgi:hypothetical protein
VQTEHAALLRLHAQTTSERDQLRQHLQDSRDEAMRLLGAKDALHQRLEDSVGSERALERALRQAAQDLT